MPQLQDLTPMQFLDDAGRNHPFFEMMQLLSDLGPATRIIVIKEWEPSKPYQQPLYYLRADRSLSEAFKTLLRLAGINRDNLRAAAVEVPGEQGKAKTK